MVIIYPHNVLLISFISFMSKNVSSINVKIGKSCIDGVINFIDDNIEKLNININMLSEYSGYSRRHLQLLFRKYIGIPIGKYIKLRRVSRASIYLILTRNKISDISEIMLFDSPQTFAREFKKVTGVSPNKYRSDKLWGFINMTGKINTSTTMPLPIIKFIPEMKVSVCSFSSVYTIPYTGDFNKTWEKISQTHCEHKKTIISYSIEPCYNINSFVINSFVWGDNDDYDKEIVIKGGKFAYFCYKGSRKDYALFINNIYMNILGKIDFKKKEYDIEIITPVNDGFFLNIIYLSWKQLL